MRGKSDVWDRLGGQIREAIFDVAAREWRDPGDQIAKYVFEGLQRDGALPSVEQKAATALAETAG